MRRTTHPIIPRFAHPPPDEKKKAHKQMPRTGRRQPERHADQHPPREPEIVEPAHVENGMLAQNGPLYHRRHDHGHENGPERLAAEIVEQLLEHEGDGRDRRIEGGRQPGAHPDRNHCLYPPPGQPERPSEGGGDRTTDMHGRALAAETVPRADRNRPRDEPPDTVAQADLSKVVVKRLFDLGNPAARRPRSDVGENDPGQQTPRARCQQKKQEPGPVAEGGPQGEHAVEHPLDHEMKTHRHQTTDRTGYHTEDQVTLRVVETDSQPIGKLFHFLLSGKPVGPPARAFGRS